MSILTIKLSHSQRDALVSLVRSRMETCSAGADADTAQAQADYASELSALRETLAEMTDLARNYELQIQDFVCSHGYGEATAEGMALAHRLIADGSTIAESAAEVVARGLTTDPETK